MSVDNSGPAFPGEQGKTPDNEWNQTWEAGMTLRQYAAIKLKVPNSGTDWLDGMIRESLRADLVANAMQALVTHNGRVDWIPDASVQMADWMLGVALKEGE